MLYYINDIKLENCAQNVQINLIWLISIQINGESHCEATWKRLARNWLETATLQWFIVEVLVEMLY